MSNASAADPSKTGADAARPDTIKVTAGDVVTRVESAKMWTISGLDYKGTVMAVEDSAFGTVVTYPGAKHLGTAHFLEIPGKPGEIEKENVIDLKFFIDDKPVSDFSPKMNISGKSFRMERKSSIRALQLESTVDIRDDVYVETAHLRTSEPVELQGSYPLMYAWTPKATSFVFGDDNGITKRGTFQTDPKNKSDDGLEKTARWMAVFEPVSGKGAVCYLIKHPENADGWLQYTDAPTIYRKLRIQSFVGKTIPAGFDGTFKSIVGFFEASQNDWEAKAQQRVNELKAKAATLDKQ